MTAVHHVPLLGIVNVAGSESKPLLLWNNLSIFLRTFPDLRCYDFTKKQGILSHFILMI